MDLFDYTMKKNQNKNAPLASRMRPTSLEDFYGQDHVLKKGKPLYRLIKADKIKSMIFYGPPGIGKTTLAFIISKTTNRLFEKLSAVTSGVKEIRAVIKEAEENLKYYNKETILFIDEIHRFNKSQQDALLPFVENGTIILIGATTENPYFEVNKALVSRCIIIEMKSLDSTAIIKLLEAAIHSEKGLKNLDIEIDSESIELLADLSSGDARKALNGLELAALSTERTGDKLIISREDIENSFIQPIVRYDKDSDEHYDTISAFIKSMRGSDPDAALIYLAKMLLAGEDPKFIARRLVIFASEDVGNADPQGLLVATAAFKACEVIGLPECELNLAQAATYLATAPKSNASYQGLLSAKESIRKNAHFTIPNTIRDAHYGGATDLGRGTGYLYPHNFGGYVKQDYMPKEFKNMKFYEPKKIGYEKRIWEYLESLKEREEEGE